MKNILIFSNPFGYGPSGKALSIARYIHDNNKNVVVYLCGGSHFKSIAGNKYKYIELDERNEQMILDAVNKISGEKFIISSQNRIVTRVAKKYKIPCAFLDGLAWFWKDIPDDHYFADVIFWLNYPNIKKKLPLKHRKKIFIIHGIVDRINKPHITNRNGGVLFYIGGCKNTLTPLPENYLNLINALFELFLKNNGKKIKIACDISSATYYKKKSYGICDHIETYSHENFIRELAKSSNFITNGGQTAVLEAMSVETPTRFFLPINLSQATLVRNIRKISDSGSTLFWEKYLSLPRCFYQYSEKDAISCLNKKAEFILKNKLLLSELFDDFNLLVSKDDSFVENNYLSDLGTTGVEDMYKILVAKWKI